MDDSHGRGRGGPLPARRGGDRAGSAFCAGADLSWLDQGNLSDNTPDRLRDKMLPFYRAWLAPQQIPVPVVAAVNGPVHRGGTLPGPGL